jgi:hypothetical protein
MLGGIGTIITVVVIILIVNAVMKKKKSNQQNTAGQTPKPSNGARSREEAIAELQNQNGGADWKLNTKNVPWVVLLIGTLVWYAKMTEPKKAS